MTRGRSDRAVAVGLECLRRCRHRLVGASDEDEVRQEYARLWRQLGDRPIEALIELPPMADPVARATIDVLTSLVTPALYTDENLRCLVIGRMGNLSLEHGNSDASCYAYTTVGNVLGPYFRRLPSRVPLRPAWARPGRAARNGTLESPRLPGLRESRQTIGRGMLGRDARSPRHAFEMRRSRPATSPTRRISCNNILTQLLASGAPLAEVQREAEAGLDFARQRSVWISSSTSSPRSSS